MAINWLFKAVLLIIQCNLGVTEWSYHWEQPSKAKGHLVSLTKEPSHTVL